MERSDFQTQIRRLVVNYSENAYRSERIEIFWRAFRDVSASVFTQAVDECIATQRAAPMFNELTDAVQEAKLRESQVMHQLQARSFLGVLENALPKAPDKELAAECVKLVRDLTKKRITPEQFEQGCEWIDAVVDQKRKSRSD